MRPRLSDTSREKPARGERRRSDRRTGRRGPERSRHQSRQALELPASAQVPDRTADPEAEKVRRAGGPLDEAVYTCCCGYLFSAAVSTTVNCPNCGSSQAW